MKKIIVNSCKGCPYADFMIKNQINEKTKRIEGRAVYRCTQVELEKCEWIEANEIWELCPLEDI